MASQRSARSSETIVDQRQADALGEVVLETDARKLKLSEKEAPMVFESIPVDILVGDYENIQISVLAKQIALLTPKDYAKFTRFAFGRLTKYFNSILYVSNRIAQLAAKQKLERTIPSVNDSGNQVNKLVSLQKSDITYMRKAYNIALKRVKDLLRSTKKTIRAVKAGEMANITQPMFGSSAVRELLTQFSGEIFGDDKFVENNLPLAASGKFIKHSIMSILFMLTYRVKIAQLQQIELPYKPAKLRNDIKGMTDERIQELEDSIAVAQTGFSEDVANFLRGQPALHDYENQDGVLTKVVADGSLGIEDALRHAAELKAEIDKKDVEEFDLGNFNSYQVTRLLHNICVSDAPAASTYGDLFSKDEYAEARDYFAVIKNSESEGFDELRRELMDEFAAINEVATALREEKERLKKPVTALQNIIEKEKESRVEKAKSSRK